jgi:hypothetical protein
MLRVGPRYESLAILQDQYLRFVDRILAGIPDPNDRFATIEEMRRQVGCLLGELGDRKVKIREEIEQSVDDDSLRGVQTSPTTEAPVGGRIDGASAATAARPEESPERQAPHQPRSRRRRQP